MNKFWQFKNSGESGATEPELLIYGPIAAQESWWSDVVTPKAFASELKALGDIPRLTVRINSNGGDVFAAIAMYTMLKDHPAFITVKIDGIAASAATIIANSGNVVKAPAAAQYMVHDPLVVLWGSYNPTDLEKMSETLDKVKASILAAYALKTKKDKSELSNMMTKETWMTAEEAKEAGFIDEIMFEEFLDSSITNDGRFMIVNSVCHDLSQFKTRPGNKPQTSAKEVLPIMFGANQPLVHQNKECEPKLSIKTIADLNRAYPDLLAEAVKAAVVNERERIKAIDEIAPTLDPQLVNKAKYDEPITAESLAFQSVKADAAKGQRYMDNREQEVTNSGADDVDTAPENANSETAIIDAIVASANKKRTGGKV